MPTKLYEISIVQCNRILNRLFLFNNQAQKVAAHEELITEDNDDYEAAGVDDDGDDDIGPSADFQVPEIEDMPAGGGGGGFDTYMEQPATGQFSLTF